MTLINAFIGTLITEAQNAWNVDFDKYGNNRITLEKLKQKSLGEEINLMVDLEELQETTMTTDSYVWFKWFWLFGISRAN